MRAKLAAIMLAVTFTVTSCSSPSKTDELFETRSPNSCTDNRDWDDIQAAAWLKGAGVIQTLATGIALKPHTPVLCRPIDIKAGLFPYSEERHVLSTHLYRDDFLGAYTGAAEVGSKRAAETCQLGMLAYAGRTQLSEADQRLVVSGQPSRVFYTGVFNNTAEPCSVPDGT